MNEIEKLSKYAEIIPEKQLTEINGGFPIADWVILQLALLEIKLNKYINKLLEQK